MKKGVDNIEIENLSGNVIDRIKLQIQELNLEISSKEDEIARLHSIIDTLESALECLDGL